MLKAKSLFLSVIFSFCCVFSYAEEAIYTINDFSGGQNSHISPYLVKDNEAVLCQNVRVDDEYGSLSKRDPMVLLVDGGSNPITGMHRFRKSDDTGKTIFSSSNSVYYDNSGTPAVIESGFTSGKRWQFITYMDKAIGVNGYDKPIKFDGKTTTTADTDSARTAGSLSAQLGAPFAELNTGTDLTAEKYYQYKVMFLVAGVTYYSNARSNPILTGANVRNIYLTDIPIGPAGTTERYIYRTVGDASKAAVLADNTFYLCATISDNSTKVLADNVTDAALVGYTAWSTSGKYDCTPPTAKFAIVHRDRAFLARTVSEPSYLFWSDEFNPDFFYAADYEPIREDDGGKITFIKEYRSLLVVGKDTTIQSFYTDSDEETSWYASTPISNIGCRNPYSADVTPYGILYYSGNALYRYTGQRSSLISDSVLDLMDDVSNMDPDSSSGFFYNDEYYFSYTSEKAGKGYNDRLLIYDFSRDSYVLDHKNVLSFMATEAGYDFSAMYTGSSDATGYIYAHRYAPSAINIRYKSDLDLGTFDDTYSEYVNSDSDDGKVKLGWDCTIDGWLTELQTKNANINTLNDIGTYLPNSIIDRPDDSGNWVSPVYQSNAASYDKAYWHENINTYGDVTWQGRTGNTSTYNAANWSGWSANFADPSGSNAASLNANAYVQLRANLYTSDINYGPELEESEGYIFKLVYDKTGSSVESSFTSKWDSGWKDLPPLGAWKNLKRIRIFYTGSSGTLSFSYYNDDKDINNSFSIDLSRSPSASDTDEYSGTESEKIFTYYCPANEDGLNPIGRLWRFGIEETGTTNWKIQKIEIKYEPSQEID